MDKYYNMPYILVTLIVLVVLAIIFVSRSKKQHNPITKLGAISLILIIAGIVFGEITTLSYELIGAGIVLAVIDIFVRARKKKIESEKP